MADDDFETLLDYVKRSRGFDFTGYKRTSLARRIQRRLEELEVSSPADYLDFLQVHPEEFGQLFNTILINVTSFFRDSGPWEYLANESIPRILERKGPDDVIRVWSAGCASGEEAYSVAMLLAEKLGSEAFRRRVKIYATDIDEEALVQARHGTYPTKDLAEVSEERRKRFFEPLQSQHVFRAEFRRSVIFGRHDLVQDAPISRLDLLLCRNTLMYFNAETQARVLARLHFALADHGFLMLGKAEMLLSHTNFFLPLDLRNRIFRKVPAANGRPAAPGGPTAPGPLEQPISASQAELRQLAFEAGPIAQVVLDGETKVMFANRTAQLILGLGEDHLGVPLQELEVSYRPVELRSPVEQAIRERGRVSVGQVQHVGRDGVARWLDISAAAIAPPGQDVVGVNLWFEDVTRSRGLEDDLQSSKQELGAAYEELQSTNEELETTNEELQSTVEELETTNEELQSTNEELETMNEELQSTNTELQTINDELNDRTGDLDRGRAFLESILASLTSAVVVVDRLFRVEVWNSEAEELWGLRDTETVGRSFLDLDIGLPLAQLGGTLRACLIDDDAPAPVVLDATNRRGRAIRCRVECSGVTGPQGEREGAVVVMTEVVDDEGS